MAEYERTEPIEATPDSVFDYLADVSNFTTYFSLMTSAKPEGTERVHVVAEVAGRTEEGEAWLHADQERRRIEWGAPGPSNYAGWLEVTGAGDSSVVTLHIKTDREETREERSQIERALNETAGNIKRLVVRPR